MSAASVNAHFHGVLRRCPENPRYFTDDTGKAILLSGSHTWCTLVDLLPIDREPKKEELFDFDRWLSFTKENGYKAAPILSGESKMGYGGGVCQVCSTIYNIVLRIPTVIEDMNWHSQGGVSYLPAGFDATVSDTKDMVFRNILPYDIRIEFESLDGVMTAFMFRDYDE